MSNHFGRKVCRFCVEKTEEVDYKDVKLLQRFLNTYGKIESRKRSGTCTRHQRKVALALKRARHLALLPYVVR